MVNCPHLEPFIHSTDRYSLRTYYIADIVLGQEVGLMNFAMFLVKLEETDKKK